MEAINAARQRVWEKQPEDYRNHAPFLEFFLTQPEARHAAPETRLF
jgi:hypothetical protein